MKDKKKEITFQPVEFPSFSTDGTAEQGQRDIDMLMDIPVQVTVELGRSNLKVREILAFEKGSVIEVDKLAGEPVDILLNQKYMATGEVVVLDENFGVRITKIVSKKDRIKKMK